MGLTSWVAFSRCCFLPRWQSPTTPTAKASIGLHFRFGQCLACILGGEGARHIKKHGLDIELIYISGSTRGIQSLIAGDVALRWRGRYVRHLRKIAGGGIAIVNSLTNTLPY